jgi:hypothetical protein
VLVACVSGIAMLTYSRILLPNGYVLSLGVYGITVGIAILTAAALVAVNRPHRPALAVTLAAAAGIGLGVLLVFIGTGAIWFSGLPRANLAEPALRFVTVEADLLVVGAALGFFAWAVWLGVSARANILAAPIASLVAVAFTLVAIYSTDEVWVPAVAPGPAPDPVQVAARKTYGDALKNWYAQVDIDVAKLEKCRTSAGREGAFTEYLEGLRTFDRVLRHLTVPDEYDFDLRALISANTSLEVQLVETLNTTDISFFGGGDAHREYVAADDLARDLSIPGY